MVTILPASASTSNSRQWLTPYEKSKGLETTTYHEAIEYYQSLAKQFPEINISAYGKTDSGEPLHLVLYSADRDFDIASIKKKARPLLLINNGIHPGEPDGIDAAMMLMRNIALKEQLANELQNVVLAVIPVYNIDGALNRNSFSRANQIGPRAYGFRGNARNYDLNRDFIKTETLNMRAFAGIFHQLDPDVLLDTHVSNGADYPYVMTLIATQKDKLGEPLGSYMDEQMLPALFKQMAATPYPMTPYVNVWNNTPDQGWEQFMDWPRYSSGYAALFNTISMMTETHMLKTHAQRVEATYAFMVNLIQYLSANGKTLIKIRQEAKVQTAKAKKIPLDWLLDKSRYESFEFMAYTATTIPSRVTTGERLFYDRSKPYTKIISFYKHYTPTLFIEKPKAYIFSQAWGNIAELLELNGVKITRLEKAVELDVEVYSIEDFKTVQAPFEGHYLHSDVKLHTASKKILFNKGDYQVNLGQATDRYIMEVLEPQGHDSFFAWNFFDSILQAKEHYSAYVFEDLAEELLKQDKTLRKRFDEKLAADENFRKKPDEQLDFIYEHSPYFEKEYRRYPIYRVK